MLEFKHSSAAVNLNLLTSQRERDLVLLARDYERLCYGYVHQHHLRVHSVLDIFAYNGSNESS